MYTKEEIYSDFDRVKQLVEALEVKYGPEFACVVTAGTGINVDVSEDEDPDHFAGGVIITGESSMLHEACYCLLKSPKFIDVLIDAMECAIIHEHKKQGKPAFLDAMLVTSLESLKKVLVMSTDQYKRLKEEEETDEAIEDLLKSAGF